MHYPVPAFDFQTALRITLTTAVIAGLFFCCGCSDPEPPAPVIPPVQTFVLLESQETPFRRFPGEVQAAESTEMSFDVPGRLIEFPARQGQTVKKGDLLARLDAENFESRLASSNASLTAARDELARRRQLRERGVIAQSELDRFQEQFEVAEAAQREARRAVEDTRMVAPVEGRVARLLVNNFQSVQAKQPVLIFQDLNTLEIDIELPESDMVGGSRGITSETAREILEAKVEFPSLRGRQFALELQDFSSEASPTARTFRVSFLFHPPEDQNILPGMTCTVLLRRRGSGEPASAEPGVFAVPVQAVGTDAGNSRVWILNPETMQVVPVAVELLGVAGDSMQVRGEGLVPGSEIVASGVRFLSEGMQVRRMESTSR